MCDMRSITQTKNVLLYQFSGFGSFKEAFVSVNIWRKLVFIATFSLRYLAFLKLPNRQNSQRKKHLTGMKILCITLSF